MSDKGINWTSINDMSDAGINWMDIDVMSMNNHGSSLIYGHPQGPTAGRLIAELLEELFLLGGGMVCGRDVPPGIPGPQWCSKWVDSLVKIILTF